MNELTRYIDADIPVDKGLLLAAVEGVKTYSHIIALIAAFLDDFNSVFWGDASCIMMRSLQRCIVIPDSSLCRPDLRGGL